MFPLWDLGLDLRAPFAQTGFISIEVLHGKTSSHDNNYFRQKDVEDWEVGKLGQRRKV